MRAFMDRARAQVREDEYVETVFGRRRYPPEINSRNGQRRQYAERTAINAPVQGTAADIIKRDMIRLHDWLEAEHGDVRMVMQVHDELVLEVPEGKVADITAKVKEFMAGAADLRVPLVVDVGVGVGVGVGENWEEAH